MVKWSPQHFMWSRENLVNGEWRTVVYETEEGGVYERFSGVIEIPVYSTSIIYVVGQTQRISIPRRDIYEVY